MAVVETPDRIMTTGSGWGDGGGGGCGIWMLLLVFLFMFRGHGFGEEGHRGGYGEGYGPDVYKRHDAEFAALNRNEWDLQKEGLISRYETLLREKDCCCHTNANIDAVKCEVKEQGEKTRFQAYELFQKNEIERKNAEIAALALKLNRIETVNETVAALRCNYGYNMYGPGGYIPAPAGYHYQGYAAGKLEPKEGCRDDLFFEGRP